MRIEQIKTNKKNWNLLYNSANADENLNSSKGNRQLFECIESLIKLPR